MALYSAYTGLDYCIYDSKEGRNYVQGYALQIFAGASQKDMIDIRHMLEDKQSNPYGYIVTDYPVKEDVPCRIVFIIYKSLLEAHLGKACLWKKSGNVHPIFVTKEPVWFHKGWVLKTYDPKLYAKDEDKYAAIKNKSGIMQELPKEEVKKWRKAWVKKNKPCYQATSKDNDMCRNSKLHSDRNCAFCAASSFADRYEGRKCIKPLKDMKKGDTI